MIYLLTLARSLPYQQVMVSLDYGETLTIPTNVVIRTLVLDSSDDLAGGGTLHIASGYKLQIYDTFVFSSGTLAGSAAVSINGSTYFSDFSDKVLGEGIRLVSTGNMSLDEGNVIFRGGTLINYGRFDITSPTSEMKFSDATYYFSSTSR